MEACETKLRRRIAIIGYEEGSAGQVHAWLGSSSEYEVDCFIHPENDLPNISAEQALKGRSARQFDFPAKGCFKGRPLLSAEDWPELLSSRGVASAVVLLGDSRRRMAEISKARRDGIELINLIHPTAVVMEDAILGDNVVLFANSLVGYRAEIGNGVFLNTGAQVDHHSVVGEGATIDPGVVMAGNVTVEPFAHLHTAAVLINRIRVGNGAIVGAGAVVIRDVGPGEKVVGVPARPIEERVPRPSDDV